MAAQVTRSGNCRWWIDDDRIVQHDGDNCFPVTCRCRNELADIQDSVDEGTIWPDLMVTIAPNEEYL